jgi:hypothetical protein
MRHWADSGRRRRKSCGAKRIVGGDEKVSPDANVGRRWQRSSNRTVEHDDARTARIAKPLRRVDAQCHSRVGTQGRF